MSRFLPSLLVSALLAPSQEELALSGRALNSGTGQPVPRAKVDLFFLPARQPGAAPISPLRLRTNTDNTGQFRYTGLPAGRAQLVVTRPQFREGREVVELAASRQDLVIRLEPLCAIEGRVVDRDGQPLRRLAVKGYSNAVEHGYRTQHETRSVTTDDRGRFRLWNLQPGSLTLRVAPREGFTWLGSTSQSSLNLHQTFAPVELPVGNLTPGEERQVEIRVSDLRPSRSIRGRLSNFTTPQTVRFLLGQGDQPLVVRPASLDPQDGTFEIHDVVPGTYQLRVQEEQASKLMRADLAIQVPDAVLDQVALSLEPTVSVAFRLHCESTVKGCFGEMALRALDGAWVHLNSRNPVEVPAGEYTVVRVDVDLGRGYATRLTAAGSDVSSDRKVSIQPGVVIEAWAKSDAGSVTVPAVPKDGEVILVPESATWLGPWSVRHFGEELLTVHGLAPGSYRVFALPKADEFPYADPEALRNLKHGVRIEVTPNSQQEVNLPGLAR